MAQDVGVRARGSRRSLEASGSNAEPIVGRTAEPEKIAASAVKPVATAVAATASRTSQDRPEARGKFLYVGDEKLYVRGVTYGTFRPDVHGDEYPRQAAVEDDFARMAERGINAVRTYTMPPERVLDAAARSGLRLLVGLAAERYVGYLNDGRSAPDIAAKVRGDVRRCAGHPALLWYSIGNEIPASIVRWFGPRRIESYIRRLCEAAREEDPGALYTYVNYPSTEYLRLPFLDLVTFNVFLESTERFDAYLARLHNLAGERPLVMSEMGLDTLRNGEDRQAELLGAQLRTAFAGGCAGAFVYSWTDEWHRGGEDVEDWAFGLTRRDRSPKPALAAVSDTYSSVPFAPDVTWPRISVVVCSYNGAATLRDTLEGVAELDYPDYEVIVVDDGSTDATPEIAAAFPFRTITTENRGLASARNTGLHAATGEIIAYIDDDARPDPHWLQHLADTFTTTDHVAVGGPNLAPAGDGLVADCVANAPGGPTHVLVTDREAEHLPGCNLAIRTDALDEIGGFDTRFRVAGDDVDVCWRLQAAGGTLGFNNAAVVWHHRRDRVRTYLRQQKGYGRAEALLERKWPEKYNGAGHLAWRGRLYGTGATSALSRLGRWRVYYGEWCTGLFQSVYEPAVGTFAALPMMPEWYVLVALLTVVSLAGLAWSPLLLAVPLLVLTAAAVVVQSALSVRRGNYPSPAASRAVQLRRAGLTLLLHLLQPAARLWGRLEYGLTPWRRRSERPGRRPLAMPLPRHVALWSDTGRPAEARLRSFERRLVDAGATVRRGGDYDRWDLEVHGPLFGSARLRLAIEEYGGGAQLVRVRTWPRWSPTAAAVAAAAAFLGASTGADGFWGVAAAAIAVVAVLVLGAFFGCVTALGSARAVVGPPRPLPERPVAAPATSLVDGEASG